MALLIWGHWWGLVLLDVSACPIMDKPLAMWRMSGLAPMGLQARADMRVEARVVVRVVVRVEVAVEVGVKAVRAGVGVARLSTVHTANISSKIHHWS